MAFLVSSTAIVSVGLGVLGAYYAITGLLTAVNPARPAQFLRPLVPRQSEASGDLRSTKTFPLQTICCNEGARRISVLAWLS